MNAKILIVDDEPDVEVLMKQKFRKQLKDETFIFFFAKNGYEALQILEQNSDIRMVISDINMPEMDGLTLLKKLEEQYPEVISIIVSAYGDMQNIRTAMNLGAFDFVTKPIDFHDLDITIDKTLSTIFKLEKAKRNKIQLDVILHELQVARDIQQSILPTTFVHSDNVDMYAAMTPARQVGGDFYDYFWIDSESLGFVIADVSGKGVPAALFMTVSRTLIRGLASENSTAADCLTKANIALAHGNAKMMFITAFYGILNLRSGVVSFVNAGHNPPFVVRKSGDVEKIEIEPQLPLGIEDKKAYKESEISLNEGDNIFLYTDGVTEAENKNKEFFGESRLIQTLENIGSCDAGEIIKKIEGAVKGFVIDSSQSDDITMMAIKFGKKL